MNLLSLKIFNVSILLFLIGGTIFALAKEVKSTLFAKKKNFFLYLLVMMVCFFIAGLFTAKNLFSSSPFVVNNILIQCWFLLSGILHLWLGNKLFEWKDDKKVPFILFTLIFALFGSIVFLFTVKYLGKGGMEYFLWTGALMFVLPYVFVSLIESAFDVPTAMYDKWYFPDKRKVSNPDKDELRNPILITLELIKQPGGPTSRIKVKAPENMTFGKFFFHFVNDYNLHNPQSPIAVNDTEGNNFGWGFYTKPGFLRGWKSIRTENTVMHNRLKESQVVICESFVA